MLIALLLLASSPLQDFYNAGDYEKVVVQAPATLTAAGTSREDSLLIYRLYASSLIALGMNQEGGGIFRRLLTMSPNLELDPESTSPKIRAVFEQVKAEMASASIPKTPVRRDTVYLGKPVPLSVLIPGLNRIQEHRSPGGYALLAGFVTSVAGLGVSIAAYDNAHRTYLLASTPSTINSSYRVANSWYKARSICIGTTSLIWAYSLLDALLDR
jgi:hypothetical protein